MAGGTTNAIISSGGTIVDVNGTKYNAIVDIKNVIRVGELLPYNGTMTVAGQDTVHRYFIVDADYIYFIIPGGGSPTAIGKFNRATGQITFSSGIHTTGITQIFDNGEYIITAGYYDQTTGMLKKVRKSDLAIVATAPQWNGTTHGVQHGVSDGTHLYLMCYIGSLGNYGIRKVNMSDLTSASATTFNPGQYISNQLFTSPDDLYIRYVNPGSGSMASILKSDMTTAAYASTLATTVLICVCSDYYIIYTTQSNTFYKVAMSGTTAAGQRTEQLPTNVFPYAIVPLPNNRHSVICNGGASTYSFYVSNPMTNNMSYAYPAMTTNYIAGSTYATGYLLDKNDATNLSFLGIFSNNYLPFRFKFVYEVTGLQPR